MAKWARVGEIPEKIPVNFVVDSRKFPELAAWIYSFPHGEMGKTVRDILNEHAKALPGEGAAADRRSDPVAVGDVDRPRPANRSFGGEAGKAPEPAPSATSGVMDAETISALAQLDRDFGG